MTSTNRYFLYTALGLGLLTPGSGQVSWGHSFKDATNPGIPFVGGVLLPMRPQDAAASGYALYATSTVDPGDGSNDRVVLSASRFNGNGDHLWDVRLNPDPLPDDGLELLAVAENENQFFASFEESGNAAFRFGLFRGADLTPLFAKRVTKGQLFAHQIEYFSGTKIGATIDQGTSIDSFVLNDTGAVLFDKRYVAPQFSANGPLVTQSFVRNLLPSGSGYGTTVTKTTNAVVGMSLTTTTQVTSFFSDLAGEVTGSGSFSFTAGLSQTPAFPATLSDDSLLYRIPATLISGGTSKTATHLVKVKPDGSLGWAKTIEDAILLGAFPTPNEIYLAGSRSQPGGGMGSTDALVLRINSSDGSILSQVPFADISFSDNASVLANDSSVYVTISSLDPNGGGPQSATTSLIKMDRDLSNPAGVQYTENHLIGVLLPDDDPVNAQRFVFTPSSQDQSEIRAFTLNANLEPASDCGIFTPLTVTLGTSLTATNLTVTTAPGNVTATDHVTTMVDTTIPLSSYDLETNEVCEQTVLTKNVEISVDENEESVVLKFPTEAETTYSIRFSPTMQNFVEIGTLNGDGSTAIFPTSLNLSKGFYVISPPPPVR